ncbi:pantoate--beta-alanine ligase [Sphingomonas sp. ASV193]|uniref:pantoate--beta-alanine ligase n=1 Tax=Sphingomonas sp. ASV193 TaxID=3144405 RepID=UPI0032E911E4
MQTVRESIGLRAAVAAWKAQGLRVALVPTMGALHAGHLALVAAAKEQAHRVAVSIFVNPLQFNDPADLDRYPRTEEADAEALREAGADLLWLPTPDSLYPEGFATTVHVAGVSDRWEGEHRPGHFDGVATVVAKLFVAAAPDVALFGEKDYQQLAVIRRMTSDLGLPVDIVGHATVRDSEGLALSSRNALLDEAGRAAAPTLGAALREAGAAILAGERVEAALSAARARLDAAGFGPVDYLAYVDADTLEPLAERRENGRLIVAAFHGKIRLIDNICVDPDTVDGSWSPRR